MKLISDENRGYYSSAEIYGFTDQDCNDYLNGHTKEELDSMTLTEKRELIIELEYNFQH